MLPLIKFVHWLTLITTRIRWNFRRNKAIGAKNKLFLAAIVYFRDI
jgi:hypothetical protein